MKQENLSFAPKKKGKIGPQVKRGRRQHIFCVWTFDQFILFFILKKSKIMVV